MTVDVSALARSSTLTLPSGSALQTPLLIPSFSSRGAPWIKEGDAYKSDIGRALSVAQEWIADVLLVSAYDLAHSHLPFAAQLEAYPPGEPFAVPALVMIDSGTYEANTALDLPDASLAPIEIRPWSESDHETFVAAC